MHALRFVVVALALVGLAGLTSGADDKAGYKDKIIGSWELVKSEGGGPPGAVVEFTKDGMVTIKITIEGKAVAMKGTYALEADKLNTVMKDGDKERKETMTIKTLTAKQLITIDEKGKADEFKKK